MKKCPLCDKEFKVLPQHLTAIHSIKKPVYSHLYEILTDDSIENLYNKGMSASQIAESINNKFNWASEQKSGVLKFLKLYSINIRSTKEAMKIWASNNQPWNKGLTQDDHDSIKSYSIKRLGKNNPIHKTTFEQRSKTNYLNKLKSQNRNDELKKHIENIKIKTKSWYEDHKNKEKYLIAYDNARHKQKENVNIGVKNYYIKYAKLGIPAPNKIFKISKPEKIIFDSLNELNIKFQHQFYVCGKSYDFYLNDFNLIIEVNGIYWHAHESIFPDGNKIHPDKKISINEIRKLDEQKFNVVLNHGYKISILWENEFSDIESGKKLIKNLIENNL